MKFEKNVLLKNYSNYRIGGSAKYFVEERGHFDGYDAKSIDPWKNGAYWQDDKPVIDQKAGFAGFGPETAPQRRDGKRNVDASSRQRTRRTISWLLRGQARERGGSSRTLPRR